MISARQKSSVGINGRKAGDATVNEPFDPAVDVQTVVTQLTQLFLDPVAAPTVQLLLAYLLLTGDEAAQPLWLRLHAVVAAAAAAGNQADQRHGRAGQTQLESGRAPGRKQRVIQLMV